VLTAKRFTADEALKAGWIDAAPSADKLF